MKKSGNVLVVQMGDGSEQAPSWNQELFQSNTPAVEAVQTELFYLATKGESVVGMVSDTENDRPIVAALVANWIAAGYAVSQVNRKDMLRKQRIIVKKDEPTDGADAGTVVDTAQAGTAPVAAVALAGTAVDTAKPEVAAAVTAQVASIVASAETAAEVQAEVQAEVVADKPVGEAPAVAVIVPADF